VRASLRCAPIVIDYREVSKLKLQHDAASAVKIDLRRIGTKERFVGLMAGRYYNHLSCDGTTYSNVSGALRVVNEDALDRSYSK
jgi:hypothetical protein